MFWIVFGCAMAVVLLLAAWGDRRRKRRGVGPADGTIPAGTDNGWRADSMSETIRGAINN